jgi:hypothetical protein
VVLQHGDMLHFDTKPLPQSMLSYLAFRVAWRTTWDQLDLAVASGDPDGGPGFIAEVPFLQGTALHIQLDVLAETWRRHLASEYYDASLLDECIVYATCEWTAGLVERDPLRVAGALRHGPYEFSAPLDLALASELRNVHQQLPAQGRFLVIGQLLDLPAEECDSWKLQLGIDDGQLQLLLDALGRWHVAPQFLENLRHLASAAEVRELGRLLGMSCPAAL